MTFLGQKSVKNGQLYLFWGLENPRRGRQARTLTTNVPKILDLKSSLEQIFSKSGCWVPLKNTPLLSSRCFIWWWNTASHVWYITWNTASHVWYITWNTASHAWYITWKLWKDHESWMLVMEAFNSTRLSKSCFWQFSQNEMFSRYLLCFPTEDGKWVCKDREHCREFSVK